MSPIRKALPTLVCAATALAMSACSSSVDNNADPTAASATDISVDDGGCTKNHDAIAKAQQTLANNLYGIAAEQSDKGTNTNPDPKGAGDPITLTFSIEGLSHPFLVKQKQLAEEAAARNGVKINVVSANDDVNQQFNDLQTAIAQGTDALMMMPANTEGLGAVLSQAETAKIPYFFTQKGMLGVKPASQVLAPYANEGKMLGEWVVDHYKGRSDVNVAIISGIPGDASSDARVNAFALPLLRACTFNIVANQPGNYRRGDSEKAAQNMLSANPNVDLVVGANDEAALGGLSALQSAGRTGVDVVGMDGETDMFTAIKNGQALATVIHKPTAGIVVDEAVKYLRGEPVPEFKVLPEDLVTKETIDAGSAEPAF
ncbi:substrate-binding domain-containing protein [Mycolicibacterium komossense]|uniref:Substrate-binding domain-containing protein n=1 Tax=Mycolicibacterium komossense TaxID=1779 RepID=A0ABT3CHM6_9MYCO|nr:substrate-binding domain-containing protein [Mycolicibacterium komossense]MCV7229034.1 substrate-binding domain-containing protein [Mycolicibacterium komossense]